MFLPLEFFYLPQELPVLFFFSDYQDIGVDQTGYAVNDIGTGLLDLLKRV